MKAAIFLGMASLAGLGLWHANDPIVRSGVAWVRNELGIQEEGTDLARAHYLAATVEEGEIRRVITATGTLQATAKVEIGSQLSGQVAKVFVDFNDKVAKDQPLAQLDERSFEARLDEARAAANLADINVSIAKAKLDRARIAAYVNEAQIAVVKARLDKAQVSLDKAQADLGRKNALSKIISVAELEDARTKKASAEADLREAQGLAAAHEQEVAGSGVDVRRAESELASAVEDVAEKEALLRAAKIELGRTTIRSPVDGVIVGKNVDGGQTLATQLEAKTLFVVAGDLRQMQIEAKVDEADISSVRVGQPSVFTVDSYPGRSFTATVRQIRKAPEVQQNVVTYTVVLSTTNDDDALLPGMTALVHITVEQVGPITKVPLAALRFNPKFHKDKDDVAQASDGIHSKSAVVWTVHETGEPKPLDINIGAEDDSYAALLSGKLAKGDRVIVGEAENSAPKQLFGIRLGF